MEASLGAKDSGIDGSNLKDSLSLAQTWPLLLFFKPRILLLLHLYLDTGLVSAEGRGEDAAAEPQERSRGCCRGWGSRGSKSPKRDKLVCVYVCVTTCVNDLDFD